MLSRRAFLCTLIAGGLSAPGVVPAQQQKSRVVAVLNDSFQGPFAPDLLQAFKRDLSELGWIEGKNLPLVYRYAEKPEQRSDPGLHAGQIQRAPVDRH